jgi:threonine aldolase
LNSLNLYNEGHLPSYGTDEITLRAKQIFREVLGSKHADVYFVFNGTGANVLSLKALLKSYQAILVSDISHLQMDECGAPEFITGCKLITVPSHLGKVNVESLKEKLIRRGDQHHVQISAVSITQPTEVGTVYTLNELREISEFCKKENLKLHIDGARLTNSIISLNCTMSEMMNAANPDIVSWGGTKNGMMFGEAVIVFDSNLVQEVHFLRKQVLQLPSKSRYIAAQFEAYFSNNLWLDIARHSLTMAKLLNEYIPKNDSIKIRYPIESNAVFATIPKDWVKKLREEYFFYVWDEKTTECRWMTSWDTQKEEIINFTNALKKLSTS